MYVPQYKNKMPRRLLPSKCYYNDAREPFFLDFPRKKKNESREREVLDYSSRFSKEKSLFAIRE